MYDCPATFYTAVAAVTTTGIQFCSFALFRFLFFLFLLSSSLSFLFFSVISPYVQTRKCANTYTRERKFDKYRRPLRAVHPRIPKVDRSQKEKEKWKLPNE